MPPLIWPLLDKLNPTVAMQRRPVAFNGRVLPQPIRQPWNTAGRLAGPGVTLYDTKLWDTRRSAPPVNVATTKPAVVHPLPLTWFLTTSPTATTTSTFLLAANGIPFTAVNTSQLALFNGSGSGKVLKIYRVWVVNSAQDTGLTGAQQLLGLNRITSATASNWTIAPVPYNSTAPDVPVQILAGSKFTVTTTDLFKRVAWSSDEANAQTGTIDEYQLVPGFTYLWDVGYNDANVEPIVCREGFGVSVQNIGYTAVAPANAGYLDVFIEFTML